MKYFKLQKGFKADDYISIDETELQRAIKARATGKTGIFKEGVISGQYIISILPDWNKEMGWNRDYQLTGEDYALIGRERQNEYNEILQFAEQNAVLEIQGKPTMEKLPPSKFAQELSDKLKGDDSQHNNRAN
jgi:hypothetical protein